MPIMNADKKTRVVFVNHSSSIGGAERNLVDVVSRLDGRKYDPSIIIMDNPGKLTEQFESNGIEVIHLPFTHYGRKDIFRYSALFLKLTNLFSKLNPAVIHANSITAGKYVSLPARIAGIRLICHIRDLGIPDLLTWVLLKNVTFFISVSYFSGRHYAEKFGSDRVQTVYDGVDVKKLSPERKSRVREQLGRTAGTYLFSCISRVYPSKRLEKVVEVFEEICNVHHEAFCLLVGDFSSSSFHEYSSLVRRNVDCSRFRDRIFLMNWVDDVAEVLCASDVLLSLSSSEAAGLTIEEALSCGVPVLARRIGGIPELIIDGETGYCVEDISPKEIAKIAVDLAENKRRGELTNKCRDRAIKYFNIDVNVRRIQEIYEVVLNG